MASLIPKGDFHPPGDAATLIQRIDRSIGQTRRLMLAATNDVDACVHALTLQEACQSAGPTLAQIKVVRGAAHVVGMPDDGDKGHTLLDQEVGQTLALFEPGVIKVITVGCKADGQEDVADVPVVTKASEKKTPATPWARWEMMAGRGAWSQPPANRTTATIR